jgi:hypothetical protein
MGIVASIPELGAGREEMLLGAVRDGYVLPISWHPIYVSHGPYQAKLYVSGDGLRIGDSAGGVRINASHGLAQQIADELGVALPTAKLSDEIWAQAQVKLSPVTQPWSQDGTMAKTYRMIQQSQAVDDAIAAAGGSGSELIADVGKDWINSARSWVAGKEGKAVNYGWHGPSFSSQAATPAGQRVIQMIGQAHSLGHVDYSQVVRLVDREVEIWGGDLGGGTAMGIDQVVADPNLAGLVSHEGPLPAMRHPSTSDIEPCSGSGCGPPADLPPGGTPPGELPPGGGPLILADLSGAKQAAILVSSIAAGYMVVRLIT